MFQASQPRCAFTSDDGNEGSCESSSRSSNSYEDPLVNHDAPLPLMMEMKAVVRALLDLPTHMKTRNIDVIVGSGYMPPSAANPLYEALGLYDMASSQAVDDFASQLDVTPHQRDIIKKFAKAIHELAMYLAQTLAEGMGLVEYLFKEWPSQFRINKYNFTPDTVGTSGVQIHSDSGFLTILQDDEDVGGLEVMDKCGKFIPINVLYCQGHSWSILVTLQRHGAMEGFAMCNIGSSVRKLKSVFQLHHSYWDQRVQWLKPQRNLSALRTLGNMFHSLLKSTGNYASLLSCRQVRPLS